MCPALARPMIRGVILLPSEMFDDCSSAACYTLWILYDPFHSLLCRTIYINILFNLCFKSYARSPKDTGSIFQAISSQEARLSSFFIAHSPLGRNFGILGNIFIRSDTDEGGKTGTKKSLSKITSQRKGEVVCLPRNTIARQLLETISDNAPHFWRILALFVRKACSDVEELGMGGSGKIKNASLGHRYIQELTFPEAILHFRAPVTPLLRPFPGI